MKWFGIISILFTSILLFSCSVYQKTSLSAIKANDFDDKKIKVQVKSQNDSTHENLQFLFKRYEFQKDSLLGYHKVWRNHPNTRLAYNDIESVLIKNTLLSELGTIGLVLGGIGTTLGVIAAVTLSQAGPD